MKKWPKTKEDSAHVLRESAAPVPSRALPSAGEPMVRTQIYLSRSEHEFLQSEAARRNTAMAAVIREFIDEKMAVPEDIWAKNPLLNPPLDDPGFEGHEDGALNHDHYISGGPKKFIKSKGQWKPAPPFEE
jgi:hypothetical protein